MSSLTKAIVLFLSWSGITWGQSAPTAAVIQNVRLSGSGCEESTARASISQDLKDLSLLLDNHVIEIGNGSPNSKIINLQKNCRIDIDIAVPRGWQYAFKSVDYRGFASLPASAWGFHRLATVSGNNIIPSLREVTLKGPTNEDYTMHVETSPSRYIWSPCISGSHTMTFYSQIGVSFYPKALDRSNAIVSIDSKDFSMRQSVGMLWKQCTPGSGSNPPPAGPRPPRL